MSKRFTHISLPRIPNGNVDWRACTVGLLSIEELGPVAILSLSRAYAEFYELGQPVLPGFTREEQQMAAVMMNVDPSKVGNPEFGYQLAVDYTLKQMNGSYSGLEDSPDEESWQRACRLTDALAEKWGAVAETTGRGGAA